MIAFKGLVEWFGVHRQSDITIFLQSDDGCCYPEGWNIYCCDDDPVPLSAFLLWRLAPFSLGVELVIRSGQFPGEGHLLTFLLP